MDAGAVNTAEWSSLHVYYNGDLDVLLSECVAPLIRDLESAGLARRFFYVRYWSGGPHIRLRILGPQSVADEIKSRVHSFLAARPGGRPDADAYAAQAQFMGALSERFAGELAVPRQYLDDAEPLQPAEVAVEQRYVFDHERYGGWAARSVSEGHFAEASRLALRVIKATRDDRPLRLGWTLSLMAAFAAPAAAHGIRPGRLFRDYFAIASEVFPNTGGDVIAALGFPSFASRRDEVLQAIEDVQNGPLIAWRAHVTECLHGLSRLHGTEQVQQIVMEYVHLLNNRLGIPLPEEFYLSYLLTEALEIAESPC